MMKMSKGKRKRLSVKRQAVKTGGGGGEAPTNRCRPDTPETDTGKERCRPDTPERETDTLRCRPDTPERETG